jgi:uncharacterized protein with NAD-binding domain and iron-sulfur cluster
MASLAAAWALTNDRRWRDHYDSITVYQQGWRVGGKGASGRNQAARNRIEEHGLHVWFGCYDNAFRMLDRCYQELARPRTARFRTVKDAFAPQDRTPAMEYTRSGWQLWPISYPRLNGQPGADGTPWHHIVKLLRYADEWFDRWLAAGGAEPRRPSRMRRLTGRLLQLPEVRPEQHPLKQSRSIAESRYADPTRPYGRVLWLIEAYRTWRRRFAIMRRLRHFKCWSDDTARTGAGSDELRRILIGIDLAVTVVLGLVRDFVLFFGLEHLDREDLRAWLRRHGAREETVWSAPVRALYDLCFAYERGEAGTGQREDPGRPNFAAGTALQCALRIALMYDQSVCYEMRAGMGEVVFAPIYEALVARGVRFEFFHRVKRLELSPDGKRVARIHIGRQAKLKQEPYQPLIHVDGLACWPATPKYEQLQDAARLKHIDLESLPPHWQDVEDRTLEVGPGKDVDRIILGIPLAALPGICGDLIRRSRRWRNMVKRIQTVQTLSLQLWMTRDVRQLGWHNGRVPVNAAPEPIDVWADMSHLLAREGWPPEARPSSVQYLCGPLSESRAAASGGPAAHVRVREIAEAWLLRYAHVLWPAAVGPAGFDWNVLHDPRRRSGAARLDAQYLRANVAPSERYVLSVAGSTKYRLAADQSGFANLFLAGDWTRTDYNAGCIEAAVISGINAAAAVAGVRRSRGRRLLVRALRLMAALLAFVLLLPVVRWVRR